MSFGPLRVGSGGSPVEVIPPAASEYWSRAIATAILDKTNPARAMDSSVFVPMVIGTYFVRGIYYFTANQGGPSIVWRMNGPAITSMNVRRGLGGGAQDTIALTPAYTARMAFDAGDVTTAMNTGGPGRALLTIEICGIVITSAAGNFGIEWTGNSALAANSVTRQPGSYLEYKKL